MDPGRRRWRRAPPRWLLHVAVQGGGVGGFGLLSWMPPAAGNASRAPAPGQRRDAWFSLDFSSRRDPPSVTHGTRPRSATWRERSFHWPDCVPQSSGPAVRRLRPPFQHVGGPVRSAPPPHRFAAHTSGGSSSSHRDSSRPAGIGRRGTRPDHLGRDRLRRGPGVRFQPESGALDRPARRSVPSGDHARTETRTCTLAQTGKSAWRTRTAPRQSSASRQHPGAARTAETHFPGGHRLMAEIHQFDGAPRAWPAAWRPPPARGKRRHGPHETDFDPRLGPRSVARAMRASSAARYGGGPGPGA